MLNLEGSLLIAGILLVLSVVLSRASEKTGIPVLLIFLGIGMLAGSEGPGGIFFDNPAIAQSVGILSLIFILFSGGLDSNSDKMKAILRPGIILATLGVAFTAFLVAIFAHRFLHFPLPQALLLGAIVSSTDAAAVFTVLRARGKALKGRLGPLLEFESGSNDPMAVLLTVSVLAFLKTENVTKGEIALGFSQQLIVGTLVGLASSRVLIKFINKINLDFEGLYPVFTLASVAFTYGVCQIFGGNGILAVYLMGLGLSQAKIVHRRSLLIFHDGVAWLAQITMFLVLGLQVFPSELVPQISSGLALSTFLIFFARPAAVFICLSGQGYSLKEKIFVSWVGLRGSVPIILATFPVVANVTGGQDIFNLVFFVVVVSVAIQGSSVGWLASKLGLFDSHQNRPRYPIEFVPTSTSNNQLVEIFIPSNWPFEGKSLIELELPKSILIVLVGRGGETFIPSGQTQLKSNDSLLVLGPATQIDSLKSLL